LTRFLYKRPIRFTRFGIIFILFAIGVGAAAINTGNNLLYLILGILLGLIVVSGILSDSSIWDLRARWEPLEDLYAGTGASWSIEIYKSRFPGVLARISTRWSFAVVNPVLLWWISARQPHRLIIRFQPERRGWLELRSVRSSTVYPFGLFEKYHEQSCDQRWLVYPKTQTLAIRTLLESAAIGMDHASNRAGQGSVPFLLRDFRSGDSARRIEWKASARTGRLWVSEMEVEAEASQTLQVTRWPRELSRDDQEDFISFLASWCRTSMEAGKAIGLQTPDHVFTPAASKVHLKQLLRYLALVDFSADAPITPSIPLRPKGMDAWSLWKTYRHGQ